MNPDAPQTPRQGLEMRVTALLLGELPADQAETLRAQIAADPELAALHARLQQAIALLREARKMPSDAAEAVPARLSAERRERLFAHFKTTPIAVTPRRRDWSWMASLGIAAALVVLVGGALTGVTRYEAYVEPADFAAPPGGVLADKEVTAERASAFRAIPPAADTPVSAMADYKPEFPPPEIAAITTTSAPTGLLSPMPATRAVAATPAPMAASSAKGLSAKDASRIAGFSGGWAKSGTASASANRSSPSITVPNISTATARSEIAATSGGIIVPAAKASPLNPNQYTGATTFSGAGTISGVGAVDGDFFTRQTSPPPAIDVGDGLTIGNPPPATPSLGITFDNLGTLTKSGSGSMVLRDGSGTKSGGGNRGDGRESEVSQLKLNGGNLGDRGTLSIQGPAGPPPAAPAPPSDALKSELPLGEIRIPPRAAPDEAKEMPVLEPFGKEDDANGRTTADASKAKKAYAEAAPDETRARALWKVQTAWQSPVRKFDAAKTRAPAPLLTPQPEIATSANAFSTFSLNVADVAFQLAAASLEKGHMPDPASMRSEEFINAFDYRDPEPVAGAPLAFASERARYPFAQNRDLLRLSVKTASAGRAPGRALNVVLLLDNSGSMERADRVRIVREALRVLAAQMQAADKLSIITFARTPRLWIDGVSGDKAAAATARVGEITPQGGTNLEAALDLGYETARRHFQPGSINRVVLLTDGAANLGDINPDALKQKVETQRQQGIALDAFGIGWEGFDDSMLETLSRNGDGRYGFINTPEAAATEFAGQLAGALRVAASDVKVQVEFNPRRVAAYRQIGYAKHQLTKEQFRDNTVDAAEIGAAESGNALYAIEVNPRGEGDIATVRVRFKVPGTSEYREHSWTVPFSPNVPPLDQSTPTLRLAATASAFSEMLAGSPFAAEVTSDALLALINGVPNVFARDPRPHKLEVMIRQAKSLLGK